MRSLVLFFAVRALALCVYNDTLAIAPGAHKTYSCSINSLNTRVIVPYVDRVPSIRSESFGGDEYEVFIYTDNKLVLEMREQSGNTFIPYYDYTALRVSITIRCTHTVTDCDLRLNIRLMSPVKSCPLAASDRCGTLGVNGETFHVGCTYSSCPSSYNNVNNRATCSGCADARECLVCRQRSPTRAPVPVTASPSVRSTPQPTVFTYETNSSDDDIGSDYATQRSEYNMQKLLFQIGLWTLVVCCCSGALKMCRSYQQRVEREERAAHRVPMYRQSSRALHRAPTERLRRSSRRAERVPEPPHSYTQNV